MPDLTLLPLFWVILLVFYSFAWLMGAMFGYRMKIRHGSRLHWPDRPLWAERKHPELEVSIHEAGWPGVVGGIPQFRKFR